MKTAARPVHRNTQTADAKAGGRARKPFFHTVQAKNDELQARSRFGRPGDKYEVEADRVADRVVDGKSAGTLAAGISPLGQRKEEEERRAEEGDSDNGDSDNGDSDNGDSGDGDENGGGGES